MIARQTAAAARADLKWLTNSAALLRRRLRHTPEEAQWWGLVRLLVTDLEMTLATAAEVATAALRSLPETNRRRPRRHAPTPAKQDPTGTAAIVIDLPRYQSTFLANLSRALILETPRRRGRTSEVTRGNAVEAARDYGIDVGLLRSALNRTPSERLQLLDANLEFVRAASRQSK
ncbi:MAG: hypothetical protein ACJ8AK_16145 [Gemmatimonadaceae bacterium]